MKTISTVLSIISLGAVGLLSSCVDPYYTGTTATVTTYNPGYVVDTLPGGYRTEVIGGVSYYRHNDVYYRPQGRRYVVVERPGGRYDRYDRHDRYERRHDHRRPSYHETRVIQRLPNGYRTVTHRGVRYYESGGTYYRSGNGGYTIVERPY